MKVTQEILPDSQVGLEIEVTPEMSKQTYDKVLQKYMRSVNIPGFRKGKVPRQVFLQRVGVGQFKAAVLEELVQEAVDEAIKQADIEAIGNYQLTSSFEQLVQQFEPGQALTIQASVDVPPRVSLDQYKGLTVQAEEVQYDAQRVEDTLEQYRLNQATLVPVEDRPAQMGDVAVIDFVGKVQGKDGELTEFPGGSAEDFEIEIQEGRFIEGFVQGIVGMAIDDTRDVEVTFPDEYPQEDLAGKAAIFTITLKDVKEKELPDLDDDFAQEISEFETLEELRNSLEERYRQEAEEKTQANKEKALLDEIVTHLQAEIPNTMIQREVDYLLTQSLMQLSRQGIDVNKLLTKDMVAGMRERTRPDAIEQLRTTLALGEVAKQESITIDENDIQARIDEMMEEVSDPEAIDHDRLRQVVEEELLQEKILAWLEEHSTVELVPEGTLADNDNGADDIDPTEELAAPESEETTEATVAAANATIEATAEVVTENSEASDGQA
ncbi:Trigger factor [Halomicronema hongdechloris C2206]|uniref:Trigger factor n=1 Tax=Halomicronema hongdechloris C2206 TaxID=1641165 RepID=A0A1Z3HI26_9CYAN|nr:trigger factor [Halomicronema hongdechloris]ASC69964.1 Trigger factor [Halomicronema hongdechloris C2206]